MTSEFNRGAKAVLDAFVNFKLPRNEGESIDDYFDRWLAGVTAAMAGVADE